MKYRKRPVTIEALQWSGEDHIPSINEMKTFLGGSSQDFTEDNKYTIDEPTFKMYLYRGSEYEGCGLVIKTLEGEMHVSKGDYVIKGVEGEYYPCKPDIFEKTYEKVDEQ